MRLSTLSAIAIMVGAVACHGTLTDVDGSCVQGVFSGEDFLIAAADLLDPDVISSEPHFRVTRHVSGCQDEGGNSRPLSGQSNFLAVGTPIHAVDGFEPTRKLAYWDVEAGAWRSLVHPEGCASGTSAAGSITEPCAG